jgi:hypothetical protein
MYFYNLFELISKYKYELEPVFEGVSFDAKKSDLLNVEYFANETEEKEEPSENYSSVEDDKALVPQAKGIFAKIKEFFNLGPSNAPQSFTIGRNQTAHIDGSMPNATGNPVGRAIAKLGDNVTKAINSIKEKSKAVNPSNPNRANAYIIGKDNLPTVSNKQRAPYEQVEVAGEKGNENQVIVPKEVPSGKIQDVGGPVLRPEGITERAMKELDGIELGHIKIDKTKGLEQDSKSEKPSQETKSESEPKDREDSHDEAER